MKSRLRAAFAALLISLSCGAAARAQVMADRLPADAFAYASWQGSDALGPAYNASHLKGLIDAFGFPTFIRDRIAAEAPANPSPEQKEEQQLAVDLLTALAKSPTALYMLPFDFATDPNRPSPRGAIASKVGPAAATDLANRLTAVMERHKIPNRPIPTAKAAGDTLVLFYGDDSAPARFTGDAPADSLASQPGFKTAMAQLSDPAQSAALVYLDGEAAGKQIELAVTTRPGAVGAQMFVPLMEGLGVTGIRQVAWAGSFDGPNWKSSMFLGMKERRVGLLGLLDAKPLSKDAYALIPAAATSAGVFRFDGPRFLADMQEMAAAVDPRGAEMFEKGLQQLYYFTGVELKKDLLPALSDEFITYTLPTPKGSSAEGFTLVSTLRDEAKATTAFNAMETFLNAMTAQRDPNTKAQFKTESLPAPYDKVTAHVMRLDQFSFCWAITGGKFLAASSLDALTAALEHSAGKPNITANPAFADLKKSIGQESLTSFSYLDLPKTGPESYAILQELMAAFSKLDPNAKLPPLPAYEKLAPHLAAALQVAWTDQQGLHVKESGPFPFAYYPTPGQFIYFKFLQSISETRRAPNIPPGAGGLP